MSGDPKLRDRRDVTEKLRDLATQYGDVIPIRAQWLFAASREIETLRSGLTQALTHNSQNIANAATIRQQARREALEEAAKVCERRADSNRITALGYEGEDDGISERFDGDADECLRLAEKIRALAVEEDDNEKLPRSQ